MSCLEKKNVEKATSAEKTPVEGRGQLWTHGLSSKTFAVVVVPHLPPHCPAFARPGKIAFCRCWSSSHFSPMLARAGTSGSG